MQTVHAHTHTQANSYTHPLALCLPLRKLHNNNSVCNNASNTNPHRGKRSVSCGISALHIKAVMEILASRHAALLVYICPSHTVMKTQKLPCEHPAGHKPTSATSRWTSIRGCLFFLEDQLTLCHPLTGITRLQCCRISLKTMVMHTRKETQSFVLFYFFFEWRKELKSTVLDMLSLTFNSDRKRKSKQDIHAIQISEKCTPNVHTLTWIRNTATDSCPLVQVLLLIHIVISDPNNRPAISNGGEGCEHICTELHAHISTYL